MLKRHAREYISDTTFDPVKLTSTDKFGVAPSNTTLSIVYRSNTDDNTNAGAQTITNVTDPIVEFDNITSLLVEKMETVVSSLEVTNEDPVVGDVTIPDVEELKIRALGNFSAQNRAVTRQDYISMTYAMPARFGAIKRCTVVRDDDSFKRNLNLYVISENREGELVPTNNTIKENLKTWLNSVRMISDTVDILDAEIINIGIEYDIVVEQNANRFEVLRAAQLALEAEVEIHKELGEPIYVSEFFKALKDIDGLLDVVDIRITNLVGDPYSDVDFDTAANSSADGRSVTPPINQIFEIKFPEVDIVGRIV